MLKSVYLSKKKPKREEMRNGNCFKVFVQNKRNKLIELSVNLVDIETKY